MNKDSAQLVPLSDMEVGCSCNIVKFGTVKDEEIQSLKDLGVMKRMPVTIIERTISGPLVLAVNDARIAIAEHIAREIFVLPKQAKKGE